jgi:hypothetical protein
MWNTPDPVLIPLNHVFVRLSFARGRKQKRLLRRNLWKMGILLRVFRPSAEA